MPRKVQLPATVTLRASHDAMLPVGVVYGAIGLSRQRAFALRRTSGFPAGSGGMIDVQAVGSWLVARGVTLNIA
jgi:hypothetical protein